MKPKTKRYLGYLAMGFIAALFATLYPCQKKDRKHTTPRDYSEIIKSGKLNAVTEYNSVSYFADGDSISGFHYELIRRFAGEKGIEANIVLEMSHEKRLRELNSGTYDIIAYSIPVTSQLKDSLLLTNPIVLNKQVLVQRKQAENDSAYISSLLELAHKTVYTVTGSPSILRIQNLSDEIGDTIYIEEFDKYGEEQLMAMVAHGDIDYAVCDENIARASIELFPQLDIDMNISFTQFYSWGINKQSPILLDSINAWLSVFIKSDEYKQLHKKYF